MRGCLEILGGIDSLGSLVEAKTIGQPRPFHRPWKGCGANDLAQKQRFSQNPTEEQSQRRL